MSKFDDQSFGQTKVLEEQIRALRQQHAEMKARADTWTPEVRSQVKPDVIQVHLKFGGKIATVSLSPDVLLTSDLTTLTSIVTSEFCEHFVQDQLRSVIQDEMQKLQMNVQSVQGAGKW